MKIVFFDDNKFIGIWVSGQKTPTNLERRVRFVDSGLGVWSKGLLISKANSKLSFEPKNQRKYFCWFFGSNENFKICFWD